MKVLGPILIHFVKCTAQAYWSSHFISCCMHS